MLFLVLLSFTFPDQQSQKKFSNVTSVQLHIFTSQNSHFNYFIWTVSNGHDVTETKEQVKEILGKNLTAFDQTVILFI